MYKINLTEDERIELKKYHRAIRDPKQRDQIKAILLLDDGYSYTEIAKILLIDNDTVRNWDKGFETKKSLKNWLATNCVGYQGKLSAKQEKIVANYVDENIISDSKQVIEFIRGKFKKEYSLSGMVDFLKRLGFKYKMTRLTPSKYDAEAQKEFKAKYEKQEAALPKNEVILFGDGVHPQHNTKCSRAWIRIGQKKEIKSNTGRQRININGVYNAQNQDVIAIEVETINAQTTIELFKKVENFYFDKTKIHIIVDNAKYYKNDLLKKYLKTSHIELIYLPPYSPNLNLIERLWKLMRKKTINSKYYEHYKDFKLAVLGFLDNCSDNRPEIRKFIGNKMHLLNSV